MVDTEGPIINYRQISLDDPKTSNFHISTTGTIFYCHDSVLFAECRKLYNLGRKEPGNNIFSVELDDVHLDAFYDMLIFIYSGKCQDHLKYLKIIGELAVEYELPNLLDYLSKSLDSITIHNATEILEYALHNNNNDLKFKALEFISDNFINVLRGGTGRFNIDRFTLMEILKIDRVCEYYHSEFDVCSAVTDYAICYTDDRRFDEDAITNGIQSVRREFLGDDLIQLIRVPTMTPMECGYTIPHLLSEEHLQDILTELNGGRQNSFGYSNVMRRQERVLSADEPNCLPTPVNVDGGASKRIIGLIPSNPSVFSVNHRVTLTDVWVYRLEKESFDVVVRLKTARGRVIADGVVKKCKSFQKTNTYQVVPFSTRLELIPDKKYTLEIEYSVKDEVEFYEHDKDPCLPYTVNRKAVFKDGKDFNITFEELNKMLVSLSM